jgi:hypothetical protein
MSIVYDHSCLMSTVKNTSGGEKVFGFLPPHGKRLADEEELNVFGDIREAINRGDRFGNRHMNALLDALDSGDLAIVSTPSAIVYDETDEVSLVVGVDNGTVTFTEPCWEVSVSEV